MLQAGHDNGTRNPFDPRLSQGNPGEIRPQVRPQPVHGHLLGSQWDRRQPTCGKDADRAEKDSGMLKGSTRIAVQHVKDRMRDGAKLMQMHSVTGMKWYVVPDREVDCEIATKVIAEPDVFSCNDGFSLESRRLTK